jgi:hypothetical protein
MRKLPDVFFRITVILLHKTVSNLIGQMMIRCTPLIRGWLREFDKQISALEAVLRGIEASSLLTRPIQCVHLLSVLMISSTMRQLRARY